MGKGDKRRNRKPLDLPALKPAPKPKKRGRARMAQLNAERDPRRTALSARARMMGMTDTEIDRDEMRTAALGEAAGRALYLGCPPDAARRWGVYAGLTAAEARYSRTVLGKNLHAKCAKIEMMPERFEARQDDMPDLRSEDERHRDAVNSWMRWQGYVGQLSSFQQTAIWAIVRGRIEPVHDAKLTQPGKLFVDAMGALADVVDGQSGTP